MAVGGGLTAGSGVSLGVLSLASCYLVYQTSHVPERSEQDHRDRERFRGDLYQLASPSADAVLLVFWGPAQVGLAERARGPYVSRPYVSRDFTGLPGAHQNTNPRLSSGVVGSVPHWLPQQLRRTTLAVSFHIESSRPSRKT